jgi:hypothetical protein
VLFVALFPANIYHWLAKIDFDGAPAPGWYHVVRLPTQGLLVGWALWLWRAPRPARASRVAHSASPAAGERPAEAHQMRGTRALRPGG